MQVSDKNPVIVLVVERHTRRVIDASRETYPYNIGGAEIERHDLTKCDIVIRSPESTIDPPEEAADTNEPEVEPIAEVTEPPRSDDDVPF